MELVLDPGIPPGLIGVAAVLACALGTVWLMGVAWAKERVAGGGSGPASTPAAPVAREDGGGEPPAAVAPALPATAACQQRAIEERRAVFARPVALAELHAEVAAIRRDERIFGDARLEDELLVLTRRDGAAECRFLGLSGQPTCPAAATSGGTCRDGGGCPCFMPRSDAPSRLVNHNRVTTGRC